MRIKFDRGHLARCLAKVCAVVEKNNNVPILEHVKIEVTDTKAVFTATDMSITIQDVIEGEFGVNCAFTTVAATLYEMVRRVQECNSITFIIEKAGEISVVAEGASGEGDSANRSGQDASLAVSRCVLPSLPSEEFPSFEVIKFGEKLEMKREDVLFLLRKTRHAISLNESRYYLSGVYLHVTDRSTLTAVATDIHRLAKASVAANSDQIDAFSGVIVPKKTVGEVIKVLEDSPQELVEVDISPTKIKFQVGELSLTSKLIDAVFPNYSAALECGTHEVLKANTKDLIRALQFVTAIVDTKSVTLTLTKNSMLIAADSVSGNRTSANQLLSIEHSRNDEIDILLNAKYLLDCLAVIDSEIVEILIGSGVNPVLVKPHKAESEGHSSVFVLMPMKVNT